MLDRFFLNYLEEKGYGSSKIFLNMVDLNKIWVSIFYKYKYEYYFVLDL